MWKKSPGAGGKLDEAAVMEIAEKLTELTPQ